MKCYGYIYIDKGRLQGIPQNFYCNYPKNSLSWNSVYPYSCMVSYDLLLFMLKIGTSTRGTNSMPFLVFGRDHLRSNLGIISGLGIISCLGIICGRGPFAALYRSVLFFLIAILLCFVTFTPSTLPSRF